MTNERLLRQATSCSNIITHPLQHALSYQIHSIFFLSQTLRLEMIEPWVFYPKCTILPAIAHSYIDGTAIRGKDTWTNSCSHSQRSNQRVLDPLSLLSHSQLSLYVLMWKQERVFPKMLSQCCQRATVQSIKICSCNRFFPFFDQPFLSLHISKAK